MVRCLLIALVTATGLGLILLPRKIGFQLFDESMPSWLVWILTAVD